MHIKVSFYLILDFSLKSCIGSNSLHFHDNMHEVPIDAPGDHSGDTISIKHENPTITKWKIYNHLSVDVKTKEPVFGSREKVLSTVRKSIDENIRKSIRV